MISSQGTYKNQLVILARADSPSPSRSVTHTHTHTHTSINKTKEILIHVTTWLKPKNMVFEKTQSQKTTYCMIPFILNVQKRQIHRVGKQISGCLGAGEVGGEGLP